MEYFNKNTSNYRNALKSNLITRYLLKLELLSYYENTIGEITKDISLEVQGQININYKQLTRRSCSLTLANIEDKYLPSPNSPIWYLRKFKLWLGIEDNHGDIWWFSQGVYCIVSATANAHTVQIEAVDKGGALDGTLKLNLAEVQYVVESGNTITDIIRDTLALNIGSNVSITNSEAYGGANMPIDPVPPLIDLRYNNQKIKADISIDANNYIGNIFTSLADGYGADVYYDGDGHFRFNALADVFFVDGYRYMAAQWDYDNLADANCQYSFDGLNAVTVYTNMSVTTETLASAQKESKEGITSSTGVSSGTLTAIPTLTKEQLQIIDDYIEILREMKTYGVNLEETVFGNIDTNQRQILEWTEENLTRFADAILSWGETADDLRGSISTVFGAWEKFGNVNIAFSPILQTSGGAVLLSANTVMTYIRALIEAAGEGWTTEALLALDVTGLVIDGVAINKLVADVGSTAERTSKIMHYTGQYGAYNQARSKVQDIATILRITVEELVELREHMTVQNISYTAYNVNPLSPIRVGAVGVRRMESQEIDYIDTTESDMQARCQQYAVMLLHRQTMVGATLNFSSPIIPHIDVNKTIRITDKYQNIDNELFVVQSVTIPLGAGAMQISATNINWLPSGINVEGMGMG